MKTNLLVKLSIIAAAAAMPVTVFGVIVNEGSNGISPVYTISGTAITIGSDGEASYDPYGFGHDTSDGINFNDANWVEDPSASGAFAAGFWTNLAESSIWVLPASTPCGSENEPACEPVAKWFNPTFSWAASQTIFVYSASGALSDIIRLDNSGPGGTAAVTFASDPTTVPDSGSTLALLGAAVVGLGLMRRRLLA